MIFTRTGSGIEQEEALKASLKRVRSVPQFSDPGRQLKTLFLTRTRTDIACVPRLYEYSITTLRREELRAERSSHSSPFKILRIKREIASLLSGRESYVKRTKEDERGVALG